MSPSGVTRSCLFAYLVLLCLKSSCAVNIGQIMKAYPDFTKMSDVLSQPDVAKQMNIQPAITVLALDNDAMDGLSATKSPEEVTDIVKCHVGFDYYDLPKMNNRQLNHPAEMVNLYQSSGSSQYGQGLTQLKKTSQGIVFFSTSTNSTKNDAKYVETLYTKNFNVSIVKVDRPMLISGLNDQMGPALSPVPPKTPGLWPAQPKAEADESAQAPTPEEEEEVVAEGPTDDTYMTEAPAPAPAEGPAADEAFNTREADAADETRGDGKGAASARKEAVGVALVLASALLCALAF